MSPEHRSIPGWAQRERQADFAWIQQNLDVFWTVVTTALEDAGRGAIVVDTTLEPISGAGNPFAHFPQEQIEEQGDEDTSRLVFECNPTQEFTAVLPKPDDHASTYRVGTVPRSPPGARAYESPPCRTAGHTPEPEVEPPDVEKLMT